MPRFCGVTRNLLSALFLSTAALQGNIAVVTLSLSADVPTAGIQEIGIRNQTGSNGCSSLYPVCTNLAIQNWALKVNYVSSALASVSPYLANWQSSADSILPQSDLTFDFDLCQGLAAFSCSSPSTVITSIVFSGQLDVSNFQIFDPSANSGAGGPGPLYSADPNFSVTLTPSTDFPGDYYESQDGTAVPNSVLPEPDLTVPTAALFFLLSGVLIRRRFALKHI